MIYRIVFLSMLSFSAFGADYAVTPDGKGDTHTLSEVNKLLQPGETANLECGKYAKHRIEPARSGKEGAYITYSGQPCAVITDPPSGIGAFMKDKSYIKLIGFSMDGGGAYKASKIDQFVQMMGGGRNIIENVDFRNAGGWACVEIGGSDWNRIVSSRFDQCGAWRNPKTGDGAGDMITLHCSTHTLVAGNEISRGGHSLMANNGDNNVIRHNLFNQKWGEGIGYRAMELTANKHFCAKTTGHSLVEYNTFKNMLKAPNKSETTGFKVEGTGHIVRYNIIDGVAGPATTCAIRPPRIPKCEGSRIYNNDVSHAEVLWETRDYSASGSAQDTIAQNNALVDTAQPKMSGSNKSISNGPAGKDSGAYLTQTTDQGSGKTVAVGDAAFFTDGFGVVGGDMVQVGKNEPAQVVSVDRDKLTLEQSISWSKGDPVGLPWVGKPPVGAEVEGDDVGRPIDPPVDPAKPATTITASVTDLVKDVIGKLADKCGMPRGDYAGVLLAAAVDPTIVVTCR